VFRKIHTCVQKFQSSTSGIKKEDGQIVKISLYATRYKNRWHIFSISVDSPKEFGKISYLVLELMMLLWRFRTMRNLLRIGGQKLRYKEEMRGKLWHQLSFSFLVRFGRNAALSVCLLSWRESKMRQKLGVCMWLSFRVM
jgi:hypothetical protein